MTKFESLHNLFVHEVQDLYNAEKQLTNALPKMMQAASNSDLKEAFRNHLDETREQLQRAERVLRLVNAAPGGVTCEAMKGLVEEGEEIIRSKAAPAVKDAALIGAAQRVEHYEMAGYGTARTFARQLGYDEAADLLQETLDEEGDANKKLTKLAEGGWFSEGINEMAEVAA